MQASGGRQFRFADVLATVGISVLLIAVFIPSLGQARRSSKIQRCADNLWSIGRSAKIYANDHGDAWMNPPHSRFAVLDGDGIDYLNNDGTTKLPNSDPGEIGWDREVESQSETRLSDEASRAVSTTRSFWLLVRSNDVRIEQFICPSSHDVPDPILDEFNYDYLAEQYYDFAGYENISYGYQVPFGQRETRPQEGANPRMVFAADKGPYYTDAFEPTFLGPRHEPLGPDGPNGQWRRYNSPNHQGQGQNVLFVDGSVTFVDRPTAGVHGDNIYTLMGDQWDGTFFNVIHGDSPHFSPFQFPHPGQGSLGFEESLYSSTDSLIYP